MTDISDERQHKPSAKHTLEEVRKSLEDLVRNEFVDAGPAPTQDPEISGQAGKPAPFAPAPPQRSRQRLQTMQKRNLDTSQVLESLNELMGNDLGETDRHDGNGVQPATKVDADTDSATPASEPGDAELAGQDMSADTESLESLAAQLAEVDQVDADTSDVVDAVELTDANATAEEIAWAESSDVSTDDAYPILHEDANDLDAAINLTADMAMADANSEEITLETAPPDASLEKAPMDEALSSTPTPGGRGLDTDTPEAPEAEGIELSLDETTVTADESLEVDFADALTPTSSGSLPSPELSLADDDDQEPGLTNDAAMPAESPSPTAVETLHSLKGDQPQESVEYPEDEEGPFVSEGQQTFEFEALEPGPSASDAGVKAAEREVVDDLEPKELHETVEIPDESPRQAENSELRLEDPKSALVEPAGEMVPLVPDEEMSMELGAELEATTEASLSADDVDVENDSPALSPMDVLEIPGEETMSEEVTEQDRAAMQNSDHEHNTAISRAASDATTVLLTPNQAQPGDHEFADEPTVELDHSEPVSESSESAAPVEGSPENKPSETKQESTPVVTLSSDKQKSVASKAPMTSPKNKIFAIASVGEVKELKMPGIDFDLGTAADEKARPVAAGDPSPDDSEYIDLAGSTSAKDAAPPVKSSKEGYKRTPWPTPSALFRKNSAPKTKQTSGMPWGHKGVGASAKGSPHVIEPPLSTAKFDASAKTLDSSRPLKQPKPKARVEQGTKNIPVLDEVVGRPAQLKKRKKKPVPLASPKAEARNVAVNVIAKLNLELRKCGERALSPVTIDRLQFLLREALEQYAKGVENSPKRH
ncbi:MAG: hypothetical protein ACE10A_14150 [Acidiferrobacterales bacterium]